MQSHSLQEFINRFVKVCQADKRVVAATLFGSHARGVADAYSDLDLGLITTDETYEDLLGGREGFVRLLGEPAFLEDFDVPNMVFFVFPDGIEGHITFGCESQFNDHHSGSYRVLLDKKGILTGVVLPRLYPTQAEQRETLRRLVHWFWHDLSHFIAALGRGQLWWAYGQLEELRRYCVNLARLRHNFAEKARGYEKVDQALPVAHLSSLQETCCPLEPDPMLQAALVIVRYYRELAPLLAQTQGITYPADLERVMTERLEKLSNTLLS